VNTLRTNIEAIQVSRGDLARRRARQSGAVVCLLGQIAVRTLLRIFFSRLQHFEAVTSAKQSAKDSYESFVEAKAELSQRQSESIKWKEQFLNMQSIVQTLRQERRERNGTPKQNLWDSDDENQSSLKY
jgi:hypothetical protein